MINASLASGNAALKNQLDRIVDKLEDCEDSIDTNLRTFTKEQKKCSEAQTSELSDRVKTIESVITEQVEKVTLANEELLKYTQKMQEEWTTLGRDEIAFLSRIWDEEE